MRWQPTARLRVWLVVVGLGVLASLASGRPEPVIVVAPVAAVLVTALVATPRPALVVSATCVAERVTEGDDVSVEVEVIASASLPSVEVLLVVPNGLHAPLRDRSWAIAMAARETRVLDVSLRCTRWGRYRLGDVSVRVHGPLGFLVAEGRLEPQLRLEVHPVAHPLRRLIRARVPRAVAGNQPTQARGPGLEFADLRPFVPGDLARDVNWRATARTGTPWVNQWHPERSADVVVLVDAFSELQLSDAVGAAAALANHHLRNRDRVGLVTFGGFVRWLSPGAGIRQEVRLAQTLLETTTFASAADKTIGQIPPQMLPRNALVLALTPLHDERMLRALVDLRSRGVDVVCVELSPVGVVAPTVGREAAYRLWAMQRAVTRDRLRELGVPVVVWERGVPLAAVVEEVAAWPRAARSVG